MKNKLCSIFDKFKRKQVECKAMKHCRNYATAKIKHPVLGIVPICDRCKKVLYYLPIAK